jgi:pimeloyl-ACP methyl ester carboxylesterase
MKIRKFALPLAGLLLAGALYENRSQRRFRARFSSPGLRVEIAPNRRLHLIAMGQRRPGAPLIVLEAGHGAWSSCWQKVMPALASRARVVACDRAGYGWSDPRRAALSPAGMVDDLRAALDRAGEPGPYLLVGHSMGSSIARLFASRCPADVAGMVWVDPVSEDLSSYMPMGGWLFGAVTAGAALGALLARFGLLRLTGLARFIARYPSGDGPQDMDMLVEQVADPAYLTILARETLVLGQASGWRGTLAHFGALPVTSLEARYPAEPPLMAVLPAPLAAAARPHWRRFRERWQSMHDALALRCENIRRVTVQGGHVIMDEYPELVIAEVLRLYADLER